MSDPRPRVRADVVVREIEDEVVAYDPLRDRTALLNRTSAFILELCDGSRTPADIARAVAASFDVEEERAAADVTAILARFRTAGLLR